MSFPSEPVKKTRLGGVTMRGRRLTTAAVCLSSTRYHAICYISETYFGRLFTVSAPAEDIHARHSLEGERVNIEGSEDRPDKKCVVYD